VAYLLVELEAPIYSLLARTPKSDMLGPPVHGSAPRLARRMGPPWKIYEGSISN